MDLPGRPATDLRAAMQEDLEQADDARLVDLEAGITHRADRDRLGERCSSEKSTCTLSHSAGKPAKRSVIAWKVVRTASR